jgi:hypothetical protein
VDAEECFDSLKIMYNLHTHMYDLMDFIESHKNKRQQNSSSVTRRSSGGPLAA